jgi:protein-arginine kinase activator protein McsA
MIKCEICGDEAENFACGHDVCAPCYDVVSDLIDELFLDPEALQTIRERVQAAQAAYTGRHNP